MHSAFLELTIILGLSCVLGFIIKYLKQPILMAYLLAGVALSVLRIIDQQHSLALTFLPEFGVAFVLFFIGMELDLREIKSLGWPIVVGSIGQIFITSIAGYVIAALLGFNLIDSVYLGLGLSFSSTVLVIKMLLEKRDLNSLYGKLALGMLLLEDLVAVLFLMGLTISTSFLNLGLQSAFPMLGLLIKALGLFFVSLVLSRYVLNTIFRAVADNAELLFLTALAWCFSFIALSQFLGFSLTIGAFLAGVALASSPYHYQIQGKVKPLRDFFVALFFIYLGSQVSFDNFGRTAPVIAVFVLYAVLIKPIVLMLLLGSFGFKKHTIFQTSVHLSQISEFSLVVALLGVQNGVVSHNVLSIMALTGVISIFLSTLFINSSRQIYKIVNPFIGLFVHGKYIHPEEKPQFNLSEVADHVIIVGAHRIGGPVVEYLTKEQINHIVLDFNPKVIEHLTKKGITALYGDVADPEILDIVNLEKARLIISTSQDREDNLHLLSEVKRRKIKAVVIVRAISPQEAKYLYKAGADYVILPEIVSGDFLTQQLRTYWPNMDFFKKREDIELRKLRGDHLAYE